MQIAIIKLGAMGDIIRTTSLLPALKNKYPGCEIDWIVERKHHDLLEDNKYIRNIYFEDSYEAGKSPNIKYELVVSLDEDRKACEIAAKLNKEKIVGALLSNGKSDYTGDSSEWFDMGLLSKFGKKEADRLKALNKKTYQEIIFSMLKLGEHKKCPPILNIREDSIKFAESFASKNRIMKNDIVVGINTGAGGRWQDKKLSIEETASLIDGINSKIKNVKILLFGGPEEVERNEKIKNSVKAEIIDAGCNNTIMDFAALVNLCSVLVTSDSLAMHIGIALRKRITAFFYATSSSEIELYGRGVRIIGKGKSYCSYQSKCEYPPEWDIEEIVNSVKKFAVILLTQAI